MPTRADLTRPAGSTRPRPRALSRPGLWTVLAGAAMVVFLGLRPWGDKTADPLAALEAFASPWWPVAHLAGACVFALLAVRAVLLAHQRPGDRGAALGAVLTGIGAVGVLLYYGMEALALHGLALSAAGQNPAEAPATADALRTGVFAMTLFGTGLLLVTVGTALSGARRGVRHAGWRHWVLVLAVAAILPHFLLPPAGRLLFGPAFLGACVLETTASHARPR